MDRAFIFALLQNVALLLATGLVLDYYWKRKLKIIGLSTQLITGVLLGTIGLMIMTTPAVLSPGLVFDTRSVLLSVSGMFFGFVPVLIAMAITTTYRLITGGDGMWMGIAVIITSGLIGIIWHTIDKEWFKKHSNAKLILLGFMVHVTMLACTLLLPVSIQGKTREGIIIPLLTIYPLGAWLFGNFLLNRLRHWKTRQLLEESELKFRLFYEHSPVAYHSVDVTGKILQVNDAWLQMLGYARDEVLGHSLTEFLRHDYAALLSEKLATDPTLMDCQNMEQIFRTKAQTEITVSASAKHDSNLDGTYKQTNFILHNITERKNAELKNAELNERLMLAAKASGFGVWDWDILNNQLTWDARMCELYGLDSNDNTGMFEKWTNALHPDTREEAKKVMDLVNSGGNDYDSSFKIVLPNGTTRHLRVLAIILHNQLGKAYRMIGINFDISNEINRQIALKESEERFREIIESSHDIHYKQNLQTGEIIYTSPSVTNILGYSVQEMIAMPIDEQRHLFAPEDASIIDEFVNQLLELDAKKMRLDLEFRMLNRNGNYRWIHGNYQLKRDKHEEPSEVIGVLRDITEAKHNQQTLLNTLKEREQILNSIPNIIWKAEISNEGEFINTYISSIVDELLKLPPKTIQNNWDAYLSHILPRYMPDVESKIRYGILNPGFTISMEYEARLGNGETAWFFSQGRAYLEDGKMNIIGYTSSINEHKQILSDLKQSEQMFKSFILNAPDGIFTCTSKGILVGANQALCTLFQSTEEHVLGKPIHSFAIPSEQETIAQCYSMPNIGEKYSESVDFETVEGLKFHALLSSIKLSDNKILGFVKNIDDIKKAHTELFAAKEKAEESDRLKSAFLAAMSHELRTPLNSIIGFSSLIDDSLPVSEMLRINKMMRQSGFHLLGIIESIFEMALLQTGHSAYNAQMVNLTDVFEQLKGLINVAVDDLQKHHLTIIYQTSNSTDVEVLTDREKLVSLLFHLANNALKYTLKGSISLECSINEDHIRFGIKDTGIGISPEKAGFIFELFRQGDDSDTRSFGGLGLGLTICTKLAHILKGRLWFESTPNVGSAFYFNLPRHKDSLAIKQLEEETRAANFLNGLCILVAEDTEENLFFIDMVFKDTGAKLITATSGLQAVAKIKEIPAIDLVLMDLKLPEMDGYEATKQICKLRPGIPVIAQTAYAMLGDREKALQAGCIDYLTKPMNKDQLIYSVMKAMESKNPTEQIQH